MSDEPGFGDSFTPSGVLSLTTDFGVVDGYVGTMKGVALAVDPGLRIVDITHLERPQEVREASFHQRHAEPNFGPGTVHLSVVDPGVGTARESLVALWEGQAFVAPDNGLLPALFAGLEGDVEYGEFLASECKTCHQTNGGDDGIPSIVLWPEEVFVTAMHAYKEQVRPNPVMQMIAGRLADDEIAALAAYFKDLKN